ncbi:MAG: hypothetical protein [Agile wallaby adenovirus 1]|nr:MAG: hypothetical protein [Agile wallaby atadenovirus 1]
MDTATSLYLFKKFLSSGLEKRSRLKRWLFGDKFEKFLWHVKCEYSSELETFVCELPTSNLLLDGIFLRELFSRLDYSSIGKRFALYAFAVKIMDKLIKDGHEENKVINAVCVPLWMARYETPV